MFVVLMMLHVLICFALMGVVLLQSGKGGGLASTLGGGGNQTLFGGRGAVDFLGKATWILGSAFMVTSLVLALLSGSQSRQGRSSEGLIPKQTATAPVLPSPAGGETSPGSGPAPLESGSPVETTPGQGAPSAVPPGETAPTPAPNSPTGGATGGTEKAPGSRGN